MSNHLETPRLTLIAATAAHIEAELASLAAFGVLVDAAVPPSWPPGEYDEPAQRFFLARLAEMGDAGIGWYCWYAIDNGEDGRMPTVIGCGGYFGPPTDAGVVELGYSVCPEWRGHGFATELATALAEHAAAQPGVTEVIAHTTAANPASIKVLERSGFTCVGPGAEPGALRFLFGRRG